MKETYAGERHSIIYHLPVNATKVFGLEGYVSVAGKAAGECMERFVEKKLQKDNGMTLVKLVQQDLVVFNDNPGKVRFFFNVVYYHRMLGRWFPAFLEG